MTREKEILKAYNEQQTKLGNQEHTFMRGAKWADAHPHWISVEDELPKEKGWIIVSTFFNSVACPAYYYEGEDVEVVRSQGITNWMHLPQAPKKGD